MTFAGVWDFEMGLRAVQLRGELMEVGWFRLKNRSIRGFFFRLEEFFLSNQKNSRMKSELKVTVRFFLQIDPKKHKGFC